MDDETSEKFIQSLAKSLHSLCNSYASYDKWVHVTGHLYFSVDTGDTIEYVVNEKMSKIEDSCVSLASKFQSFHSVDSNSFHAQRTLGRCASGGGGGPCGGEAATSAKGDVTCEVTGVVKSELVDYGDDFCGSGHGGSALIKATKDTTKKLCRKQSAASHSGISTTVPPKKKAAFKWKVPPPSSSDSVNDDPVGGQVGDTAAMMDSDATIDNDDTHTAAFDDNHDGGGDDFPVDNENDNNESLSVEADNKSVFPSHSIENEALPLSGEMKMATGDTAADMTLGDYESSTLATYNTSSLQGQLPSACTEYLSSKENDGKICQLVNYQKPDGLGILYLPLLKSSPAANSTEKDAELLRLCEEVGSDTKQEMEFKKFICDVCGSSFKWSRSLRRHRMSHFEEKPPYSCIQCGYRCTQLCNLKVHIRKHLDVKPEKKCICQICAKAFWTGADLQKHIRIHTGERPYTCSMCPKAFKTKNQLKDHQSVHSTLKPYRCEICLSCFKTAQSLKSHRRKHDPEGKKYICMFCNEGFHLKITLTNHINSKHTKVKPHKCDVCGKGFSSKGIMKEHLLTHSTERPFSCDICPAAFQTKFKLRAHLKSHLNDEECYMYQCTECDKSYKYSSHLNVHIRRFHLGERRYSCPVCHKRFFSRYDLSKHEKRHHISGDSGAKYMLQQEQPSGDGCGQLSEGGSSDGGGGGGGTFQVYEQEVSSDSS